MGLLSKLFQNRTVQFTDWNAPIITTNNEILSTDSALNVSSVYAAINVKANSIAKLPLQVYQKTATGRDRINNQISYLLEVRPNPYQTPFNFKHTMEVHRNTHGVAYVKMEFNQRGQVEALYLLNPSSVAVAFGVDEQTKKEKVFYIEQTLEKGKQNIYDEDEIIRIPYLTNDGFTPKSPIKVAMETIYTLKNQQKFLSSFYSNGTLSRGILKVPTQLNKEAKEKVRAAWMEANAGIDNASRIAVLDNGFDFQNITIPLQEAEFIASQKFGIEEIARIFNVPLHMINSLDRATWGNIEQQSMDFVMNTLAPSCVAWEEEFNYKLFTKQEQLNGMYVKFNLASALRGDSQARANYYKTMLEMGVYNINEVRELEEKDAIANGNKHLISLNFTTLDNLENYQNAKKSGE